VGIRAAKGDYVLFLDVDDELTDGSLVKLYAYLSEHEPMDMLVTRQIRNNGTREWMKGEPPLEEHKRYSGVEAHRLHYVRTNAGGGICRRAFLLENDLFFPAGVKNAEDTIFFGQLQVYAKSIVYYNLPLYLIHEIAGSASHDVDHTKLGKNHIIAMRSVAEVKSSLKGTREQKAIFDYVVYQLLSNTVQEFVASKELTYGQFKEEVPLKKLLPLDIGNMHIMRSNALLFNLNLPLAYLLLWLRHRLTSTKTRE
jgi:glycosyltransferase involved in cell wall biosynthesis